MTERVTEAKTYVVEYICDNCGEGQMRPVGLVLTVDPPMYKHRCEKCGIEDDYQIKYPTTRYAWDLNL